MESCECCGGERCGFELCRQIVIRAFFPQKGFDESSVGQFRDPGWKMLVPLTLFVIAMILFGLYSAPLTELFGDVAAGLL